MSGRAWRWGRLVLGAAVLAVLVWRVGADAFLAGLRRVDGPALVAAVALNAVATLACAWRWRAVAGALGAALTLPSALAAYYRAQFLNTTLPGGVLGDVHRGLRHGREVDDVGRGLRAVAWERGIGQGVQVVIVLGMLAIFPSPLQSALPYALLGAGLLALLVAVGWTLFRMAPRWSRTLHRDARALLSSRAWSPGLVASVVVVIAHGTTFVVAARTAGVGASGFVLVPLAAVVLLAMAVPANIGGWGPREGVAAWAFAAAGMTAAQGVAAATVYGVLVLAASLPGAAVLIAPRRRVAVPAPASPPVARVPVGSGRG